MATFPGVRSPLGCPPHLRDALVPSGSHSRGSWSPSPMPSRAGSHVPGRAAVPAPPSLALYPMAGRQAGGRGGRWSRPSGTDASSLSPAWGRGLAVPPRRVSVSATGVAQGGEGGNRPGWAEATCLAHRIRGEVFRDAQVLQGLLGAGVAPVAAHRWTSMLTRSLSTPSPLPPLRCLPSAASPPLPP